MGHNDGVMGTDLETFLASVPADSIQKIWLDFKNLNEVNHIQALHELERLDKIFNLKNKAILESGWKAEEFKVFREAGWMTSYYLPTKKAVEALQRNDAAELTRETLKKTS